MRPDAITWLGHAGVCIDLGGVRVLTDPVLRDRVGPLRRVGRSPAVEQWADADVVLISHLHHDHLDVPSLRLVPPDVPVLVPAGGARVLRGHRDVREVRAGDEVTVGTTRITVVRAEHPGDRLGTRLRAQPVGYLAHGGGRSVWFAGDTAAFPAMRGLRGAVDVALLPVGGWGPTLGTGHLDPRQAAQVAALVAARHAIPVHWGTLLLPGVRRLRPDLGVRAGERFRDAVAQLAGDTRVTVLESATSTGIP